MSWLRKIARVFRLTTDSGQEVRVYVNPTLDQTRSLLKNSIEPELRFIVTEDGTLYVWDGWLMDHWGVAMKLGIRNADVHGEVFNEEQINQQIFCGVETV